jgi:hypothetical protein
VELVTFSSKFFSHLPVFVFAFTCHQNVSGTRTQGGSGLSYPYFLIYRSSRCIMNFKTTASASSTRPSESP